MKKLNELIKCNYDTLIKGIKVNSQEVEPGDLFICVDFKTVDRHQFIDDAINRGASAIISQKKLKNKKVPVIVVDNPNDVLTSICNRFYDFPLNDLTMIGVTGTDGKTSVTSIIQMLLQSNNCGYIGTNGISYADKFLKGSNTTPSGDKLFSYLKKFVDSNCHYCSMEVSSEAYLTERISNLQFKIGAFTNITKEHLDRHGTFDNYFSCKMKLLANSEVVVINHDSNYFDDIKKVNKNYYTYGMTESDLTIKDYQLFIDHTNINFLYKGKCYQITSPLVGSFNVYNLACAMLILLILNYSISDIIERINNIKQIKGRNEIIKSEKNNYCICIDHAHTINATENILKFLKPFAKNHLITVVGCAGGRYHEKRPLIGNLVLQYSDYVIFTMDDPRSEDPDLIIDDMLKNNLTTTDYCRIINRKDAIYKALSIAVNGDVVLILGRGHDNVLHLNGYDSIHNDYDVVNEYLKKN